MIIWHKKEISSIISKSKPLLAVIYLGKTFWEGIKSCFGGGSWDNNKPWDNNDGWNNG